MGWAETEPVWREAVPVSPRQVSVLSTPGAWSTDSESERGGGGGAQNWISRCRNNRIGGGGGREGRTAGGRQGLF